MSLEETLMDVLEAEPALTSLIGTRIYPLRLPEGATLTDTSTDLPAITYQRVSGREMAEVPIDFGYYQFTVFGRTYSEVVTVHDALMYALDRYKGGPVFNATNKNATDLIDLETGLPYRAVDFRVAYNTEFGD